MQTTSTNSDKELVDLETQYWQSMRDKDVETAIRLTDDPCIVTGAQGVSQVDRQSFTQLMKNAKWDLLDFELADVQARRLTDDVAVVAYRVRERLTVDGEPVTLEASDSSTWVRRDGGWVCAVHTEAVAGDPFGRDRSTAD